MEKELESLASWLSTAGLHIPHDERTLATIYKIMFRTEAGDYLGELVSIVPLISSVLESIALLCRVNGFRKVEDLADFMEKKDNEQLLNILAQLSLNQHKKEHD